MFLFLLKHDIIVCYGLLSSYAQLLVMDKQTVIIIAVQWMQLARILKCIDSIDTIDQINVCMYTIIVIEVELCYQWPVNGSKRLI